MQSNTHLSMRNSANLKAKCPYGICGLSWHNPRGGFLNFTKPVEPVTQQESGSVWRVCSKEQWSDSKMGHRPAESAPAGSDQPRLCRRSLSWPNDDHLEEVALHWPEQNKTWIWWTLEMTHAHRYVRYWWTRPQWTPAIFRAISWCLPTFYVYFPVFQNAGKYAGFRFKSPTASTLVSSDVTSQDNANPWDMC